MKKKVKSEQISSAIYKEWKKYCYRCWLNAVGHIYMCVYKNV